MQRKTVVGLMSVVCLLVVIGLGIYLNGGLGVRVATVTVQCEGETHVRYTALPNLEMGQQPACC